ncbi:MAG: hypothetical protein JST37_02490 [Bacteroidetes bacterium]|nr:hypothetical protein [Bacteroidota bacterium]
MHERLELQQLTITGTTYDYNNSEWKTIQVIYASIIKNRGALIDTNYGEFYKDMIWMYCRYTGLPKKGMRILYYGLNYTITSIEVSPTIPKNLTIGMKLDS